MARLVSIICCGVLAAGQLWAASSVSSLTALKTLVRQGNADVQMAAQRVAQAQATLRYTQGVYWHPELSVSADYFDTRRQPTNPFQSARTQEFSWDAQLLQKTPFGVSLTAGVGNQWDKYFQAEPVNALLPFPASYHQPSVSLGIEVDLLENAFGYLTRRELQDKHADYEIATLQHATAERALVTSAIGAYTQLITLRQAERAMQDMVERLQVLQRDVQRQFDRHVVEAADVHRLQALLQARRGDVAELKQTRAQMVAALQHLLGHARLGIVPQESLPILLRTAERCDALVDQRAYDTAASRALQVARLQWKQAQRKSESTRHQILPDMTLHAGVSATGTDEKLGAAFSEAGRIDRPIYSVGVNFEWPLSLRRARAGAQMAKANAQAAQVQWEQVQAEKRIAWDRLRQQRNANSQEHQHAQAMVSASIERILAAQTQFEQGRMSLYQLTEEELQHLQYTIHAQQVMQRRILHTLETLQEFDVLECSLVN